MAAIDESELISRYRPVQMARRLRGAETAAVGESREDVTVRASLIWELKRDGRPKCRLHSTQFSVFVMAANTGRSGICLAGSDHRTPEDASREAEIPCSHWLFHSNRYRAVIRY